MPVEISYKGRANPDRDAVCDCLNYLGSFRSFKIVAREFKRASTPADFHRLNLQCAMVVGIAGFPFFAMIRRYAGQERFKAYWDSGLLDEN